MGASGPSFPSGHTAWATAVFGLIFVLAIRGRHYWPAAGAALIVAAIGPSRLLLGVHYFSDVLAGYAIQVLELRHRQRARCEDHIRNDKDTGLRNLPFRDFEHNRVWLTLVLIAHDLIAWTQRLTLTGDLARAEPKRLRYRLLHVAGRLAFHARVAILRINARWPWAHVLVDAFACARALPAPA